MANKDFQTGLAFGILMKGQAETDPIATVDSADYGANNEITINDGSTDEHTLTPVFSNAGKVTSLVYDNKTINVQYDSNGVLTKVGGTTLSDFDDYPYESAEYLAKTVKFQTPNGTSPETYSDFQIVSTINNIAIAQPTTPTPPQGKFFQGWLDGDTAITFPYIPSTNKTIVANYQPVRTSMEITEANTVLATGSGSPTWVVKENNEVSLSCTFRYNGWYSRPIIVSLSKTINGARVKKEGVVQEYNGTYTYNGETWYYWANNQYYENSVFDSKVYLTYETSAENAIINTLAHYFYAD